MYRILQFTHNKIQEKIAGNNLTLPWKVDLSYMLDYWSTNAEIIINNMKKKIMSIFKIFSGFLVLNLYELQNVVDGSQKRFFGGAKWTICERLKFDFKDRNNFRDEWC